MNKLIQLVTVILISVMATTAFAQVGKVIIAKGETYAVDATSQSRTIKRRSVILEGDTLITGADGEVHIRFNDNAILALRANSQLKINEYHGQSNGQPEKVLMELLSGGFRTITGSFGKSNKEAYQIKTPNASIGIRGTNYEAVISGPDLVVGVYDGGVKLQNPSGTLNLGLDSAFSFAKVASPQGPIQGLVQPPAELTEALTVSTNDVAPATDSEEGDNSEQANVQEEDDDALNIENVAIEEESAPTQPAPIETAVRPILNPLKTLSQSTEQAIEKLKKEANLSEYADARLTLAQLHELNNNPGVGFVVVNDHSDYMPAVFKAENLITAGPTVGSVTFDIVLTSQHGTKVIPVLIGSVTLSEATIMSAISTAIDANQDMLDGSSTLIPSNIKVSVDPSGRLTLTGFGNNDDENGSLKFEINNFSGVAADVNDVKISLGLCTGDCSNMSTFTSDSHAYGSIDGATHYGYVLKGENGPVFVNYESESITVLNGGFKTPDNVFRGHPDATNTRFDSLDTNNDGVNDIDWGFWDANTSQPAILMSDPNNATVSEKMDKGFYYVRATPAKQAVLTGLRTFDCNPCTGNNWHAQSSTGNVTSLSANLEVSFSSGEAVGNVNITDANDNAWDLTYFGMASGSKINSEFAFGTLNYQGSTYDAVGQVDGMFVGDSSQLGFLAGFGFNTTNMDNFHQSTEGVFYIPE
ncbi:FecR family protein [Reinekea forsetii]|nr:FecR family protein [Reinekea forsetii]